MNKNLGILTEHIATQQQIQYFVCKEYHPLTLPMDESRGFLVMKRQFISDRRV
jgi:hypothetical protein